MQYNIGEKEKYIVRRIKKGKNKRRLKRPYLLVVSFGILKKNEKLIIKKLILFFFVDLFYIFFFA